MISLIQGRTVSLYNMICRQFCINEMTLDPNQLLSKQPVRVSLAGDAPEKCTGLLHL